MDRMYVLEIRDNVNRDNTLIAFESKYPFGAINKGDLIDPEQWNTDEDYSGLKLQVVEIIHLFWSSLGNTHRIIVFVQSIDWDGPEILVI